MSENFTHHLDGVDFWAKTVPLRQINKSTWEILKTMVCLYNFNIKQKEAGRTTHLPGQDSNFGLEYFVCKKNQFNDAWSDGWSRVV